MVQSQEPRKSFALHTALPAALAAGGVFAARRIPGAGLFGKDIAQAARRGGIFQHVGGADSTVATEGPLKHLWNYLQFGTHNVGNVEENPELLDKIRKHKMVIEGGGSLSRKADTALQATKRPMIGGGREWDDKLREAMQWQNASPGFMSPSAELRIPATGSAPEAVKAVQARLGSLGMPKFILKGRQDAQTGQSLITDKTDLKDLVRQHQAWKRTGMLRTPSGVTYTKDQLDRLQAADPDAYMRLKRSLNLNALEHLDTLMQGKGLLAQERKALIPGGEMRVHVRNGKVIPGASTPRAELSSTSAPGHLRAILGKLVGLDPAKGTEQWLQERLNAVPVARRGQIARNLNADVAHSHDGPFAIETNPDSQSGYLNPTFLAPTRPQQLAVNSNQALNSHMLMSAIQGRDTALLAGLRAGIAGAGVGAGAEGLRRSQ